jgi:hypothetical protein
LQAGRPRSTSFARSDSRDPRFLHLQGLVEQNQIRASAGRNYANIRDAEKLRRIARGHGRGFLK